MIVALTGSFRLHGLRSHLYAMHELAHQLSSYNPVPLLWPRVSRPAALDQCPRW